MGYEPVTHTVTERRLGRLPSGSAVTVPVHRYDGGPGSTVYVQAAQHGIELNGPATIRRLHDRLVDAEVAGTVVTVPVVNPMAFDNRSYLTPAAYDARNPNFNRVWPGDDAGTLQERLAARLWEVAADADAAVDLHTGTADMLQHVRYHQGDATARDLATAFATDYLMVDDVEVSEAQLGGDDADEDGARPDGGGSDATGTTFREALAAVDVPAITVELSNSRTIDREAVETGIDGLENLLRDRGLLRGESADPADQTLLRDEGMLVEADVSGLFELRPGLSVGDRVAVGDRVGTIYDPGTFERRESVTVTENGVTYSLAREAVVIAGERVAGIAHPV